MTSSSDIYEFLLNNIQKVVVPEELIKLEMSLSRFELVALMTTEKSQNVTMSILAQKIAVPMSTATGIVDRLVKKGLLERGRSDEDRRVVTVSPTEKGKRVVSEVNIHFEKFIEKISAVITEDEFETVIRIVKKVVLGLQSAGVGSATTKANTDIKRKSIEIE